MQSGLIKKSGIRSSQSAYLTYVIIVKWFIVNSLFAGVNDRQLWSCFNRLDVYG